MAFFREALAERGLKPLNHMFWMVCFLEQNSLSKMLSRQFKKLRHFIGVDWTLKWHKFLPQNCFYFIYLRMVKREITTKEILWIISCKEFSTNHKKEKIQSKQNFFQDQDQTNRIMIILEFWKVLQIYFSD